MSTKETFIILTPGFPESEADTTCLPMQQYFARTMQQRFPELGIVVVSFQYPYHQRPYQWHGIQVIPLGGRNAKGVKKLWLRRKAMKALGRIRQSGPVRGLLSFWYNECALVGKSFAGRYDVKHFAWLLGQDAKKENRYPEKLKPKAGELIALSDFLQAEFEKNHHVRPAFVIPPGVGQQVFNDEHQDRDIDILGVGSLIPLKRYDIFLEVVAEIKRKVPAVKVMLAGKGPEKDKLQSTSRQLDLDHNITLTGELPNPGVLQLMKRAKVLLHTSSYEGFSGVCLEALSAGARVISFCRPMNRDLPGWYIVENKKEMVERALTILTGLDIEPGRPSIYSMESCVESIMSLFEHSPDG